ncbi:MAG TPA: DUF4251 domain-containing protein [Flavobacteriaceae bacterium]|nr:DUF4251 domain-containing protein [Flavobacteriaceae bacterium]
MRYLFIIIILVLFSCSSAKLADNDTKKVNTAKIEELIEKEAFKINVDYAFPKTSSQFNQAVQNLNLSAVGNSANRINIQGEGYYLEIKKDSVIAVLPFYGEQYSGYQITTHDRIEFKGDSEKYEINADPTKKSNRTRISFQIADANRIGEWYDVSLLIFENGKTDMQVSSSRRSIMAYRGEVEGEEAE